VPAAQQRAAGGGGAPGRIGVRLSTRTLSKKTHVGLDYARKSRRTSVDVEVGF
jgi:hypothetical protein